MTTASLENCKELYELSRTKWMGAPSECVSSSCTHHAFYDNGTFICPKYGSGYLLSKLPERTDDIRDTAMLGRATNNKGWSVVYRDLTQIADTPEDALCKLLIELIKQGVIK